MKMELPLTAEGIDRACEEVQAFLEKTGMKQREVVAGRLSFENIMHSWSQRYGENVQAKLKLGNMHGKPGLRIAVPGDRFDPRDMATEDKKYMPIARATMEASGFIPTYDYLGGYNIVTFTRPRPPLSSLAQIAIAAALGVTVALLGNALFPEDGVHYALDKFVTPVFKVYMAMLSGLSGPLIFFTVAWGVCGIGDVATLGRSGKTLVGSFLRDNVVATVLACAVCIPFFSLPAEGAQGGGDFAGDIVKMLLDLLPTNIVKAFADGNTSQIIILSVFVGIAALVLGNTSKALRKGIQELNSLLMFLMEQLCRFIPLFIFVMVIQQIWSGTIAKLLDMWLPLLLVIGLSAVFFIVRTLYSSARFRISAGKLLSALKPAMILGLTTSSTCAALGKMVSGCTDELGVDEDQTSFGIPLGMMLAKPPTIIMLVVLMLHCMQTYNLGADLTWYVRMALMCFLYSMVAPPVPGGMIVCIGLLFGKLGIPNEAIALATAFSIIIDYIVTAFKTGNIMLGVFDMSCILGSVDRSKFEGSEPNDAEPKSAEPKDAEPKGAKFESIVPEGA